MNFLNSHRLFPALTLLLCWMAIAPVALAQPVIQLASGDFHTVALLSNGTVMAWGYNYTGQLGLGNSGSGTNQNTPQLIPGLTGVSSIAAGFHHTLALLSNGTVMAWGRNSEGELGVGSVDHRGRRQLIPGLTGVSSASSGSYHTLALLSNGTVMAWGRNGWGQLGLGNATINQNTPQFINCIVGGPYALSLGHTADYINASMTCGGAAAASDWYFNVFSTDALNASNPGTGTWFGLHIDAAALYSHFDLALGGFPLVFGQLNSGGGQSTSIAFPTALLAGVTIYGVSITADPVTNAISGASAVTAHSF